MVDATVEILDRGHILGDPNGMVEGTTVASEREPNPVVERVETNVFNLVIDHPEGTILWDTGSHPACGDGHWPDQLYQEVYHYDARDHHLEDDLAAVGYDLADVDCVLLSHLHIDHAGGLSLFDGTDVPVLVHEEEVKYAYYSAKTDEGSGAYVAGDFDYDLNWSVVFGDRLTPFEGVELVHLPGHTPGLLGAVLHLDDPGTVVLTSDQAYLPANYEDGVPLGAGLLWDRTAWRRSLERVRELERVNDAVEVVYGHDAEQLARLRAEWG